VMYVVTRVSLAEMVGSPPGVRSTAMSSDGGKGSVPRPIAVDRVTYDSNWDIIFNRKKRKRIRSLMRIF